MEKNKPSKFEVAEVKKAQHETLVEAKEQYNEKISSLDLKIIALQNSTRTTIPGLTRLHNFFRTHSKWYHDWHINPISSKVHSTILAIIIYMLIAFVFIQIFFEV